MSHQILQESLNSKWAGVLDYNEGVGRIKDQHRRNVTAVILENTEKALAGEAGVNRLINEATNVTSGVQNFDPVMLALVRRAMPNLIAYDVMGVQPMTGPTGLIFALRSRYGSQAGDEMFYGEANTGFTTVTAGNTTVGQAANNVGTTPTGNSSTYNFAGGMSTAQMETLGASGNVAWAEAGITIDKVTVTAKGRALKAQYSPEMAQDLKAIHGLDAETELSSIITTEILAEINREAIRTIYLCAKTGATKNVTTSGTYDVDVDSSGRWMAEKFKGLIYQVKREASQIARDTRRGRGNIIIASADTVIALGEAGRLDFAPALQANEFNVDDTGNTFAGVLDGQFKVYIDPYATVDYYVVGYKGADSRDAGIFYAPYVPLQMARAVDPSTLQPVIGFKTRYGMTANPFAEGTTAGAGALTMNSNVYYRRALVTNL